MKTSQVGANSSDLRSFAYDGYGNLRSKAGVGTYAYFGAHPSRLKTAGGDSFTYDGDGTRTVRRRIGGTALCPGRYLNSACAVAGTIGLSRTSRGVLAYRISLAYMAVCIGLKSMEGTDALLCPPPPQAPFWPPLSGMAALC